MLTLLLLLHQSAASMQSAARERGRESERGSERSGGGTVSGWYLITSLGDSALLGLNLLVNLLTVRTANRHTQG